MAKDNSHFFDAKNNWSEIKDKILGCYIRPYFQKLLATHAAIHYIDCFAGKGKFADGKDGSPIIALKARNESLLNRKASSKSTIYTHFIDIRYAKDLEENLSDYKTNWDIEIISGAFESSIGDILSKLKHTNVFLYIDPYGIEALNSNLLFNFSTYGFFSFEMLINFNSFGFFRDACRAMSVEYDKADPAFSDLDELVEYSPTIITNAPSPSSLLSNILGGEEWIPIVRDYKDKKIDGYKAEEEISLAYKRNLRKHYAYVLDMPICLKPGAHSKYRMIHACNHVDGCYLMAHTMQRRTDELAIKVQQNGQTDMFELLGDLRTNRVDSPYITYNDLKVKILKHVMSTPSDFINYNTFIANFSNDNSVFPFKPIQQILEELHQERKIRLERKPAYTLKMQPSRRWEEDKDHKLLIWKI